MNPLPQPPHAYLFEIRVAGCTTAHPGKLVASSRSNLACTGELVTSALSFLVAQAS